MTEVQVLVCNSLSPIDMYGSSFKALVKEAFIRGEYIQRGKSFEVDLFGEAAAEEVFDLTNNPYRQEERVMKYGREISVSVGHLVKVNDTLFLCAQCGWEEL